MRNRKMLKWLWALLCLLPRLLLARIIRMQATVVEQMGTNMTGNSGAFRGCDAGLGAGLVGLFYPKKLWENVLVFVYTGCGLQFVGAAAGWNDLFVVLKPAVFNAGG